MDLKEHRIYKYMSTPLRIVGLTLDEISIGIIGFISFYLTQSKILGGVLFASSIIAVIFWKKIKKQASGFSFMSFVNWYFGGSIAGIGKYWPASYQRKWLA